MINKKLFLLSIILLLVLSSTVALAMTAEEIIDRLDENEYFTSAYIEAEMIVVQGNRTREMRLNSFGEGENALIEFTHPPAERGTKFLKRGDTLYMYFPDAEDIVQASGHMLEQNMMGSDFSYQDMMEEERLTDLYDFELLGEEEIEGRMAYLLEGIKKEGAENVQYYRRKIWIDAERFIGLREELYAQSGRLLKVGRVIEVKEIDGRWFPMESIMEDQLRRNTETRFIINHIDFDPEIEEGVFSLSSF
ncbi:outer membrane lipoprotein-sorting protein [Natronospora cellulosivora (SeqCode)]